MPSLQPHRLCGILQKGPSTCMTSARTESRASGLQVRNVCSPVYREEVRRLDPARQADDCARALSAASYTSHVTRLFAADFKGLSEEKLQDCILAVICFDHFCRSIDHATDSSRGTMTAVHEGTLIFSKGIALASKLAQEPAWLFSKLDGYLQEASNGERYLRRHRGAVFSCGQLLGLTVRGLDPRRRNLGRLARLRHGFRDLADRSDVRPSFSSQKHPRARLATRKEMAR